MKKINKIAFIIALLFNLVPINAQSYLGYTVQTSNLRNGPGSNYELLGEIPKLSYVYIFSLSTENDYYHIIDIGTATEGYVYKDFIEIEKVIPKSTEKLFQPKGYNSSVNPEVKITNSTDLTLTLKLNNTNYSFSPYETTKVILTPGLYDFVASCPGVIPYYGSDNLVSNTLYTWEFYIIEK